VRSSSRQESSSAAVAQGSEAKEERNHWSLKSGEWVERAATVAATRAA